MKYFIRKNSIRYSNHYFHKGKATQIVGWFDDFKSSKIVYNQLVIDEINRILGDGFGLEETSQIELYNLFVYRNIVVERRQLHSVINQNTQVNSIWDNNNLYMGIHNTKDVELFDQLYPTHTYEIKFTNEEVLLAPEWNSEFFNSANIETPKTKITYDECQLSDSYSTMGLYTDELDYWTNLLRDLDAFHFVRSQFQFEKIYDELLSKDPSYVHLFTERSNRKVLRDPSAFNYWRINKDLQIPPIKFEQVSLADSRNYEKTKFKELVIELYLANRFVPAHYYSHQEMMDGVSNNFWGELSIEQGFAKEIITENIDIVKTKATELIKGY